MQLSVSGLPAGLSFSAAQQAITGIPAQAGSSTMQLTGEPVRFGITNELATTTAPGPYSLKLYTDNPTISLQAV